MMIAIPSLPSKRTKKVFISKKTAKRIQRRIQLSGEWARWMIHTGQDPKANWGVSYAGFYTDFT